MDAGKSFPQRITELLSSFVHPDKERSTEEGGGEEAAVKAISPTKPRDKEAFYSRLQTFSKLKWFAKPSSLSPLCCARYGWENTAPDLLKCVSCRAVLRGKLLESHTSQIYEKSVRKVEESLRTAHRPMCPWKLNSTPESYTRVELCERQECLTGLGGRVNTLMELGCRLPRIKPQYLQEMAVSEDTLTQVAGIVKRLNTLPDGNMAVLEVATILAICGWTYKPKTKNAILFCKFCQRQVGVWNLESLADGEKESQEDSDEPQAKKAKKQKSAFHPVAEHCTWCPWLEVGDNESCNTSLADDSLDDSQSECSSSPAAAWRRLLCLVQQPSSPAKDSGESLLDSSHSNGHTPIPSQSSLRNIRKILKECKSPKSPPKNS